jgi:tRNA threonylcarbamoyladenosine biosynthesis protein TsaB
MKVLAIDTSNYVLGISIVDDEKVIAEYITNLKKNHSVRVMSALEHVMRECDLTPSDLNKIVVAKGPGSYTGVRIGVTIAKSLAWSLDIPLVGISSLEVAASTVGRYFQGEVSPLFDARRGQIYTGLFSCNKNKLSIIENDRILLSKDWALQLSERTEPVLIVGNDVTIHRSIFEDALGHRAHFAEITEHNPRPSELALLGKDRPGEEIHSFVPNYIRLVEAEAKWLESNERKSRLERSE